MSKESIEGARAMAKARWEKTTPEERSKHGKKMVNAREQKRKQNA